MQQPTTSTPPTKCVHLGTFASTMLGKFADRPTLVACATKMKAATDALAAAQGAYASAVLAIVAARVEVRFADFVADRAVQQAKRNAEHADGEAGGKRASTVFPNGTTPIIKPVGQTQVTEMIALEGRYEALGAIWPEAPAEKTKVQKTRVDYEKALVFRKQAGEKAAALRAARDLAKEDFLDVYAAVAAQVKAEFPRNRKMQDLFFDEVTARPAAADDDEADDGADDAPVAGGEKTPG